MTLIKPKDFIIPFTWEERRPHLTENLLYIPQYYTEHKAFPDPIYARNKVVHLEFCSGNGAWVLEKAKENPLIQWIGVEIQFERARKIWVKMKNERADNLFVVCGEAYTFSQYYAPSHFVDEIFINFPDPWPKERHAKNRLIKPPFLNEIARLLKKGGRITFVTDDEAYREETLLHFLQNSNYCPLHPSPHYIGDIPGYGSSYFDSLWRGQGKSISFLQFCTK